MIPTPTEKAKELISKFKWKGKYETPLNHGSERENSMADTAYRQGQYDALANKVSAEQCAIIAVDEIIAILHRLDVVGNIVIYYVEVKKEIEKLKLQ